MQIWGLGRGAEYENPALEDESVPFEYVSASDVQLTGLRDKHPRPLTIPEIKEYIADFGKAAANAVQAGFDGIEVHAANGYLCDQFTQDVTNKRTDEFGGSIEGRCKFVLEIMREVCRAVGQDRAAVRFSPWSLFQSNYQLGLPVDSAQDFSFFIQICEWPIPYQHLAT